MISENKDLGFPFPKDFWWGTSLAAHQSEGGNTNSWTAWEDLQGKIKNNEKSGLACDHWNRYHEDFERLSWLNANTHRLSIEWSRLEPLEGVWDEKAAIHYRDILKDLKTRKIRSVVCLFHFTLPLWVAEQGGFENPNIISAFVEFSKRSLEAFGDLTDDWLTLNEPVVYALGSYAAGLTPPGVQDYSRAMQVSVNMLKAHGRVYHELKKLKPGSRVSWAQHLRVFTPKNFFSPFDQWGARVADEALNWSWYRTIQTGKIHINIPTIFKADEEAPECLDAMDYIGMNYYTRDVLSVNIFTQRKFFFSSPKKCEKTDMGWEIYPEGIRKILKGIKKHHLDQYPILITENGLADRDDKKRSDFIYKHLKVFLETCYELGLKPMGYLYWSLLDNFEWIDGYYPRFGLFEIEYSSQDRRPRNSAHYFREMGRIHSLVPPDGFKAF